SSNENVALVNDDGLVTMPRKGEAVVSARYGPLMALSTLVVLQHDPQFACPNVPENNYIDRFVHDKLRKLEIIPSDLCSDEEFLRRSCYDLLALPPTPVEIRAFRADKRPDKRSRVVDALLA